MDNLTVVSVVGCDHRPADFYVLARLTYQYTGSDFRFTEMQDRLI